MGLLWMWAGLSCFLSSGYVDVVGKRGWMNWESSIDIYALPCLKSEKAMAPHSSALAWQIHGWRSLVGCSPWGRSESDTTEQLHFHMGSEALSQRHTHQFFFYSKMSDCYYQLG